MANIQIAISENGKTTLDIKGKFCEEYIDINVDVPAEATKFTNVLEYADSLELNTRFASDGNSYNTNQPNAMIAVTLNLDKLPGGNPLKNNTNEIRFRGCSHVDTAFAQSSDGVTYETKSLLPIYSRVDEYGDLVFSRGYIEGSYVRFNIGLSAYATSSNTALPNDFDPIAAGCIVTFNEAIGNGGYVASDEVSYTNALSLAVDSDNTPYNGGLGYRTGYRLDSGGDEKTDIPSMKVIGFIPVKAGDTVHLSGITMGPDSAYAETTYIYLYTGSFEVMYSCYFKMSENSAYAIENGGMVVDENNNVVELRLNNSLFPNWNDSYAGNVEYIRFCAEEINESSIITINEEITR